MVPADGTCWIVILGHAHLYGTKSQFNVLDTDFDQKEFGEWLKPLPCAEQVVIMTTPIYGSCGGQIAGYPPCENLFWQRILRRISLLLLLISYLC